MLGERLDTLIHPPARLQLMAMLAEVTDMEFGTARALLGVSDSVLSKHLSQLVEGGYVRLRKATVNTRQKTWIAATQEGRDAFKSHVAALQALAAGRSLSSR
jgi:DNA-binding MarR family transcriptional regulator